MFSELPVARCGDALADTILRKGSRPSDRVTVVQGEAGSGKSTGLPILMTSRGQQIFMGQPTKLGVTTLAHRVADLGHWTLGEHVGYRHAGESLFGPKSQVLFAPVATAFNQLLARGRRFPWILCVDEAHLWTRDVEFTLALAKQRLKSSKHFRLVVSSATIDASELSEYFGGVEVFEIAGREYDVTEMKPVGDLVDCVVWGIKQGRNVLFFERGVEQIEDWNSKIRVALEREGLSASIHSLHSNAKPNDQRVCFERGQGLKVIGATNYAETSVTIPNIGLVVDTGMHNQLEVHNGVEVLCARVIPRSSRTQRKYRTGREMDGIYMDLCREEKRSDYGQPEISRSFLSGHILRVLASNRDFNSMDFFHKPPDELVEQAYRELQTLRLLDKNLAVNDRGRRAAFLGVQPSTAAMLLEANSRGVLQEVAMVAALRESGGLGAKSTRLQRDDSDYFEEVELLSQLLDVGGQYCAEAGVHPVAYRRVEEAYRILARRLEETDGFEMKSGHDRRKVQQAILAGQLDQLYRFRRGSAHKLGSARVCDARTRLQLQEGELICGDPRDTQRIGQERFSISRSLRSISKVRPDDLLELAPHLLDKQPQSTFCYDPTKDCVVRSSVISIHGESIAVEATTVEDTAKAHRVFTRWLAAFLCGRQSAQSVLSIESSEVDTSTRSSTTSLLEFRKRRQDEQVQMKLREQESAWRQNLALQLESLRRSYLSRNEEISELNRRAGSSVCSPHTADSLLPHIRALIGAASCLAEVESWSSLKAPVIEKAIVKKVMHENPPLIELPSGRRVSVEYHRSSQPQVSVSDWWRELPDGVVSLPGGRKVEFVIFGSVGPSTDLEKLKHEADAMGF